MTLKRWEHYTDIPMLILSAVFLFAYSWEILARTHMQLCNIIIDIIWISYAIDYVVSLTLAPDRKSWFKKNLLLLLSIALPVFRPLRLLQLVAILQLFNKSATTALRNRITIYAVGAFVLIIYVGSLAEYAAEYNAPGAKLTSFPTTLWWAFVTVTTVGYGDLYPVTMQGRIIAVILMLAGIAMIGIVTAIISSWIIAQINEETILQESDQTMLLDTDAQLTQAQLSALNQTIADLSLELRDVKRRLKKEQRKGHIETATYTVKEQIQTESITPTPVTVSRHSAPTDQFAPRTPIVPVNRAVIPTKRRHYSNQAHYTSPRRHK